LVLQSPPTRTLHTHITTTPAAAVRTTTVSAAPAANLPRTHLPGEMLGAAGRSHTTLARCNSVTSIPQFPQHNQTQPVFLFFGSLTLSFLSLPLSACFSFRKGKLVILKIIVPLDLPYLGGLLYMPFRT